jgi:hypothetical protein
MSACSAISSPRPSSAAYIPELAAKLDDDSRLTDGARRCGRKIAELAYRRNREGRALEITVSYLMNALERSRRPRCRAICASSRPAAISRSRSSSAGGRGCAPAWVVHLLKTLLPRHGWPEKLGKPGAQKVAQNYNAKKIPRDLWALRCWDGQIRARIRTLPPFPGIAEGQAGAAK